jgi:tetratricopeptide (TPR) repeat protein
MNRKRSPITRWIASPILFTGLLGLWTTAHVHQNTPAASQSTASDSTPVTADAARHLFRAGKYKAAADAYQELAKNASGGATAYAGLAWSLLKLDQVDEAYTAASKAVELGPASPQAHTAMGEVLFRRGQIVEAQNEFLPLAQERTEEARAYLGLARAYLASSFYQHAKAMTEEAYSKDPQDLEIQAMHNEWLSPSARISALEAYLAVMGNLSQQERARGEERLARLRELSKWQDHPCHLVGTVGPTQGNLEVLQNSGRDIRGYGIKARIDKGTATLTVDTAASGLLLDKAFAEKAGVRKVAEASGFQLGDQREARGYLARADSIRVGDLEFQDCIVHVVEKWPSSVTIGNSRSSGALDSLPSFSREASDFITLPPGATLSADTLGVVVDGLIGADVFSDFLVEIDYPGLKFKLSELPPLPGEKPVSPALQVISPGIAGVNDRYVAPEMKSYSPVYRFGHDLLIETRAGLSDLRLFLINTGSFGSSISQRVAREATKGPAKGPPEVRETSGKGKNTVIVDKLNIQFGHVQQEQRNISTFDHSGLSRSLGTEVSGSLGLQLLSILDVKIDYRDGLVDFGVDPRRARNH